MSEQVIAWIGLGSNLGDSEQIIIDVLSRISEVPEVALIQWSSLYSTPPWGDEEQPYFINAVASVNTSFSADELLGYLQSLELRFGRTRSARRWGPRTLDLDVLLYAQQIISLDYLTVPHPRIAERPFVLVPLAEVAPDLNIPELGRVEDCLARIDSEGVNKLYRPDLLIESRPG